MGVILLWGTLGSDRTGGFLKRNYPFTWGSSSSFTTFENGAKRCWVR